MVALVKACPGPVLSTRALLSAAAESESGSSHAGYGRLALALHALPAAPYNLCCIEQGALHNSLLEVPGRCLGAP